MEHIERGLTEAEARGRLAIHGPNLIVKPREVSFLGIVAEEITEPMILLLLFVGAVYSLWGKLEDALTIFVVIILLVLAEVWNEYRAKKAIASLAKIAAPVAGVLRDGAIKEVKAEEVVPGDVLALSQGTRVAADARLLVSYSLQVDESALTGESFPVLKKEGEEVYAGTVVVSGEGLAEAVATGRGTRLGRLSAAAREIKPPKTPLQKAMKSLAKGLVFVALFFSFLIPFLGYIRGQPLREMVLTGLALAFSIIPEELPIIITMVLGLGAYQLSREGFLVKKLKAAEVLGDATVILTDKTGTITENRMRVVWAYPPDKEKEVLSAAMASMTGLSRSPTDMAIMEKARDMGIRAEGAVLRERSFDATKKTRALIRRLDSGNELFVTGAPERVLKSSLEPRPDIERAMLEEASKGRRVVAVARKAVLEGQEEMPFDELERDVDVAGIVAIEDPPRNGVKETIKRARDAGVRTIMVTGDHPLTAAYIAGEVGIPGERVITGAELASMSDDGLRREVERVSVFARVTPEDKYRLVKAMRENGEVVAVTGDGINDTLALKAADIGIAMGIRGTDVAREAADVVLADDNFVTIGHGIFQGRKFFDNLKKGLKYYLSVKTALILVFLVPVLLGLPLPLAPIQIILLELFMDLAASAGFVAEPAERSIYEPITKKKLFDRGMLAGIGLSGLSLFAAVFGPYYYALSRGLPLEGARTFAFTAWIMGHIFLAFVSRSEREPLISLGPFTNVAMDVWAAAAFAFLFLILATPLGALVKATPLTASQIFLIACIALVATLWQEAIKMLKNIPKTEKA
ncbi:cation-transporting P-type ATPase, HAD superfamily, subfamily IC [Methanocella conradii HZ254]|uniref:Cation-transporting P-type ATPase, HAD superfamily, subfamily IC n=1 Tax=Methanocella conradii (strain DSM 24694 / JCM 17849 / CGMCC 1.5162 / HZ254) TaxID=1041930 RepID=H8I8D5_METCZ|nr:cation-transporting P-type ATPase [Methanocella conradii]AFC98988.1 cation-transporting P-type ATPase, HAD superfamily, subfamily IC [Methanocella conradii HZ254]